MTKAQLLKAMDVWRSPGGWKLFARQLLQVDLDPEQEAILDSVQINPRTSVVSGTARGKDFVAAVVSICFMYLTPRWNAKGEMIGNTKIAQTAPSGRQVENIMFPEISRLFNRAKVLPGRLVSSDIRTDIVEWFLTGFKADDHTHESWSGFHAVNTLFVVTEASGIGDDTFSAIEGNLQGNSRILILFNANASTGYAAESQRSPRWNKFRLDSLTAPNVLQKQQVIPGQVDYHWVVDKVKIWCTPIRQDEFSDDEGDFNFEIDGVMCAYRPNDLFRIKVRGMFPKVSADTLIPLHWVQMAQKRWHDFKKDGQKVTDQLRLGIDVAGMGRDSSSFCFRHGYFLSHFHMVQSGGLANHMELAGLTIRFVKENTNPDEGKHPSAFIDTIGEGAGVFSRTQELGYSNIHSVKFSEAAQWRDKPLNDITGQYEFVNMRAYLHWAVRDWLDPNKGSKAMLPPDDELMQEMTEVKYSFRSDGKILIEKKEDIKKRLKRSPDKFDALLNTFYPVPDQEPFPNRKQQNMGQYFF